MTNRPAVSAGTAAVRRTVVLASASSGRLAVLRAAGIDPVVRVSGVDEDAIGATVPGATPPEFVAALAAAKAAAVALSIAAEFPEAVVIGGDSMLLIGGVLQGKPVTPEEALRRWRAMAGQTGRLLTGHTVIALRSGEQIGSASGTGSTAVRFGRPGEAELAAYIDSGEPLGVAGAFTIDGLGGWFVDGIDGDPSCIIGLSLPLIRALLAELGIAVSDLWR